MSTQMPPEGAAASLQSRIDELSTQMILEGVGANLSNQLRVLSEAARQSGWTETAQAAQRLAEDAGEIPAGEGGESEARIRQGLSALLKVLETENNRLQPVVPGGTSTPPASAPVNSLATDPELVGDFILESREHLANIETQMLVLEQTPGAMDAIHAVFRGFHTIKGLAGFLEFISIQTVAHEVETLLDLARNEKLSITPAIVDTILESADYLKESIDSVELTIAGKQAKAVRESASLLARIRQSTVEQKPAVVEPAQELPSILPDLPKAETPSPESKPVQMAPLVPSPAVETQPATPVAVKNQNNQQENARAARTNNEPAKSGDSFSIRVDTGKLDHLMEMVGEMVIAQSILRCSPALSHAMDPSLLANMSQLARITAEVQRTAMAMRMVPAGQLFARSARMVRDLSRKIGKDVSFEISGEDTELDKTIAEELTDPLLHMVRNAIDHGIEMPDARRAAGKNPMACLRLSAYHKAGQIVIEIGDDGRGLDRDKILNKARDKGLVTDKSQLSDNEVHHLIFEPGFSTADQITDISGRGVGMDVVRKNIQKLRGRIDIQTKPGEGTTFFLRLPLTLAIIEGLVVVVGEHRYIVPLFAVKEMFRATSETLSTIQGRDEIALVRGKLLPIVRLEKRLNIQGRSREITEGLLIVAECEGKQFCLLVDDLIGKQEVVIKSLGESLKNVSGVAGCAILGDGRVGLILDMSGIYRGHA